MPVLDATAISVSVLRGDFNIAGSVMFLLGIGETAGRMDPQKISGRSSAKHVGSGKKGMA